MTRGEILAYLRGQYPEIGSELGFSAQDSLSGYGPAIDMALRTVGIAEASLAAPTLPTSVTVLDVLTLAEYFAILRFLKAVALKVDIRIDSPTAQKLQDQMTRHLGSLADRMKGFLEQRGFLAGDFSMEFLNLDFLEAQAVES